LPKGTFNRGTTLFLLKREIAQALRYNTAFSALPLSIVTITPKKPVSPGTISRDEVRNAIMQRLLKIVRDTDLVCSLDENIVFVLLTMTEEEGANMALQRICKSLSVDNFVVRDLLLEVKLAAMVTTFRRERTPTLKDFIATLETDLKSLVKSLEESA
jgi:PleD family two-component response regulator